MAPSITFENSGTDSGDLITAAQTLGVPHPPGYPTYTLLAWLATRLPIGTIAYRVNLLSAVAAALSVGFACLNIQILLGDSPSSRVISLAAALALAFSPLFWSQAVISEVYALLVLFAAVITWLLLRWRDGGSDSRLWLAGLLLGLGLGNHLTLVFAAPAALVLLWSERRRWFSIRVLLPSAILFFVGLGIYAYLPWAARTNPPVNWGNPQTWKGFLWVVTAEQYQAFVFGLPSAEIVERLGIWSLRLGAQFGWWGLALVLVGAWWWWRKDRGFLLFSLAWMLPLVLYAFSYDTGDSYVYCIVPLSHLSIWWAGGASLVLGVVRKLTAKPAWSRLALALVLALPLLSLALYWQQTDLSNDWEAYAYARQALDGTEPDSLVIVRGDRPTFALWYTVYAEEHRSDVAIVSGPMLAFVWYRRHMRQLYPDVTIPEPPKHAQITYDDLVRELAIANLDKVNVYATDPRESWEEWFDFEKGDAPIYRVQPKSLWRQDP